MSAGLKNTYLSGSTQVSSDVANAISGSALFNNTQLIIGNYFTNWTSVTDGGSVTNSLNYLQLQSSGTAEKFGMSHQRCGNVADAGAGLTMSFDKNLILQGIICVFDDCATG